MRRLSFLILGLAVGLSSFATIIQSYGHTQLGTLKYPANPRHFDWTNLDALKSGTLCLTASGSFDTLNPYTLEGTSPIGTDDFLRYGVNELNELLVVDISLYDPPGDEPTSNYSLVTKNVEYAENRSWVIFSLRPRARFHDGRPITASDMTLPYRTLIKQGHPMYRTCLQGVKRIGILIPHRVHFVLRRSGSPLLILCLDELPMLPQHYWKDHDFRATILIVPLGNGLYHVVEVDPGRRPVFERAEGWWSEELSVNYGKYNFDRVVVDFYRDNDVALEAFKADGFDFHIKHRTKDWLSNYHFPAVLRGDVTRTEIPHQIPDQTQALFMNTRRAVFKECTLRQALGRMFDFEQTNRTLFSSSYLHSRSYYLNSRFAASGVPEDQEWLCLSPYRKQLPAQLFKQPFSLSTTERRGIPCETLRHALGLLADTSWRLFGDRLLSKEGEPPCSEILLINPSLEHILRSYRENLTSIGIDARLRIIDHVRHKQRLNQFGYDMILMTLSQTLGPGLEQWQYLHSDQMKVKGSKNYAGIADPVVDAILNRLLGTHSRDKRIVATRALGRTLL